MSAADNLVLDDIALARRVSERLCTISGGTAADIAAMVVLATLAVDCLNRAASRVEGGTYLNS